MCPVCAAALEVPNEPGIVRVGCAFNDRKVEKVCPASKQALDDLKTKSTCSPSIAVGTCQRLGSSGYYRVRWAESGGGGAHAPNSDGMPIAGLLDHQEGSATPHGVVDHLERRDKKVVKVLGLGAADPGPNVPVCPLCDDLASACACFLRPLLLMASWHA